jgi:DNA/RNA-binding protein KIN17
MLPIDYGSWNELTSSQNATRFSSLTELARYLGREGICRVTEDEKDGALLIAWVDNSPEALRRRDALTKKDKQRGDEEREQKAILAQVKRAAMNAKEESDVDEEKKYLERKEGEKISLNFGSKSIAEPLSQSNTPQPAAEDGSTPLSSSTEQAKSAASEQSSGPSASGPVKMSLGTIAPKKQNVFSSRKNNPLASKKAFVKEPPKKISEMERIMKEETEKKRQRDGQGGGGGGKKIKIGP